MTTVVDTREDLEEAMANLVATLHRMPDHWVDRRAEYHRRIDLLLTRHQALTK